VCIDIYTHIQGSFCKTLQHTRLCCNDVQTHHPQLQGILTEDAYFSLQREEAQCVVVCCSVLQCVAVRCSVLQCVAECCSVLQCVAVCRNVLQWVAVCCSVWLCVAVCVAVCCSVLLCVAVRYNVLQCVAVCCSVLQCVTVCCIVLHANFSLQQGSSHFVPACVAVCVAAHYTAL